MKFDLHCHTKEGSVDAKVSIFDFANKLIDLGFDGMLVTDHNSYKGYDAWEANADNIKLNGPFVMLKGLEYDTGDGGHFICILPDKVKTRMLEARGMKVKDLVKVVHRLGGVLGPAHPYDTGYYAYMHTRASRKDPFLIKKFDFIEGFNSCAKPFSNVQSRILAILHKKVMTAGSDSHKIEVVGTAFTEIDYPITCNDDLIKAIKSHARTRITEEIYETMHAHVNIIIEKLGIAGYVVYNKAGAARYHHIRKRHIDGLNQALRKSKSKKSSLK